MKLYGFIVQKSSHRPNPVLLKEKKENFPDHDVVMPHEDVVMSHEDVVMTHEDVVMAHEDVVITHKDVVMTARLSTSLTLGKINRSETGVCELGFKAY